MIQFHEKVIKNRPENLNLDNRQQLFHKKIIIEIIIDNITDSDNIILYPLPAKFFAYLFLQNRVTKNDVKSYLFLPIIIFH